MKRIRGYTALIVATIVVIAASIVSYGVWGAKLAEPPKVIAVSSAVAPFSEIDFSRWSTRIVVGTVTKSLPAVWDDNKEYALTPIVVAIERQVKGPSAVKEITVYLKGGTVGNVNTVVSEEARLEQGQRYLLFLSNMPRQRSEKLTTVMAYMGVVNLDGDLAYVKRAPAGLNKPEPLGQLIANIEAAMRGGFVPTPTPTLGPIPTPFPSGGLYPPKPPRPVKPGE